MVLVQAQQEGQDHHGPPGSGRDGEDLTSSAGVVRCGVEVKILDCYLAHLSQQHHHQVPVDVVKQLHQYVGYVGESG